MTKRTDTQPPISEEAYDLVIFDRVHLVAPESREAARRRREGRYAVTGHRNGTYEGAVFHSATAARRFLRDRGFLPRKIGGLILWNRTADSLSKAST